MRNRQNKRDYECRVCGCILDDEEMEENNCICNICVVNGSKKEGEEDYNYWVDYK